MKLPLQVSVLGMCAAMLGWHAFAATNELAKDAPAVAIVYPTASLTIDQARTPTIPLQATATDSDEPILYVKFWVCTASAGACSGTPVAAGTVNSGAYQVQWTVPRVLSDRAVSTTYLVWAEAQNTLGQARQSPSVAFTVVQPAPGPTVKLIAPTGPTGEVGFVSPATPVLYATATPGNTTPASSIVKVDFLDGANVIGSVSTPNALPSGYAFTWKNATAGIHSITARATDSLGDLATSQPVSIYVLAAHQPPKVTLTAPLTGQSFNSRGSIGLAASVLTGSGRIQRVEFVAGTTVIATALSAPYAANWVNPPAGNFTISARAIDDMGSSTASPAAYLEVLPAPRLPRVVLTAPTSGAAVASGIPLSLAATAVAPDGAIGRVDFYSGSTLIGSTSIAPYRFNWTAPTVGSLMLTAKAYDLQGASGTSTPIAITVKNTQPPLVTLTASPSASTYAAPATVKLAASASAPSGAVAKVDFIANGTVLGTRTATPYEYVWSNASAGSYSVIAKATDSLGAIGNSAPLAVKIVNNAAPTVQLTAPSEGQIVYAGQPVAFSATAADADGTIAKVEFLVDGNMVATAASAPFNTLWNATQTGSHVLAVRATDNLGTSTLSLSRTIDVSPNVVPTVAVTTPSAGQAFTAGEPIALAVSAVDGDGALARIEYIADGMVVASTTTIPFTQTWSGGIAGTHLLTARATDNRGATTVSVPVPITITTSTVPVVALVYPTENRTVGVGSIVPLYANASVTGASIARVEFYASGILVGTASAPPYTFAWKPASAGNYTISAKAIDTRNIANVSGSVVTEVVAPALTITTPAANASIAADFTTVSGTYQGPPNVGITVNGAIANVDGQGSYFVNRLPLVAGTNTLTVTLTSADGQSTTQTRTVTSAGIAPMQVYTEQDAQFASATFTINLQNRAGAQFKTVTYQNLAGAQLDTSMLDQATLGKLTYTTPGVYNPVFVITDAAGSTYTQSVTLLVRDRTAVDAMLKATWSDFAGALARGDKNSALIAMSSPARVKYGPVFDDLAPYMSQIIPTWSAPISGVVGEEVGEFTIRRNIDGVNQVFFIYFVRDGYGIWRLSMM